MMIIVIITVISGRAGLLQTSESAQPLPSRLAPSFLGGAKRVLAAGSFSRARTLTFVCAIVVEGLRSFAENVICSM